MNADLNMRWEHLDTRCTLTLSGRITIDSSPGLRDVLLRRVQSTDCQILTLDFCEVAYIDMSGLAVLVEVLKAARAQGKSLQLSRLQERPRYFLEATRLLHLFVEVNPEIPEAIPSQSEKAS
jgi:anti-sigma B factor antagonist